MTTTSDVIVVGAGVMGLASAWALKRAGRDVTVLEGREVGNARGSSHGTSRIFRFAYDEAVWVELAQQALPLWRELEQESGTELLSLTGSLDVRPETSALRAALDECGAEYKLLDPATVRQRFGLDAKADALLQPQGGVVWADKALAAFAASVHVVEGVIVEDMLGSADGGVQLTTSSGPMNANLVVSAPGAWIGPLLHEAIGVDPVVTRETVAYFDLPGVHTLPSVIDWNVETGRHAYALAAGPDLLKVGLHHSGVIADPNEPGEPDPVVVDEIAAWVRRSYLEANPAPIRAETCLYTSIEDDRFKVVRHGPIIFCSACSGHGFKFAPAVGMNVAERLLS